MKKIILVGITILLIACNDNKKTATRQPSNKDLQRFEFDVSNCSSNNFSDYFEITKIVPLESTDKSLIKRVSNTHINENEILVFDYDLMKILLFDRDGRFIRQIGSKGRGPTEYTKINDFSTTIGHDTISIYDQMNHAVYRYNKQGEFLNKEKIDSYFGSFEIWKNKKFVLFTRGTIFFPKDSKISNFCVFNKKGKLIYEDLFYGHTEMLQTKKLRHNDVYQLEDGRINVQEFFNDTIFVYDGEQLEPRFYFDFKERALPTKLKYSFLNRSKRHYKNFINQVEDSKHIHNWDSFWYENDDFITTTRQSGTIQEYFIFIDKRNSKHLIFRRFDQHFGWKMLPTLRGITQNCETNELVFTIDPYWLKIMGGKGKKQFDKYKQQYPKEALIFEEAISNTLDNDNPLLVFAKLKDYEKDQ